MTGVVSGPAKVTITGGAGFIGTSLVHAFAAAGAAPTVVDTARRLERDRDQFEGIPMVACANDEQALLGDLWAETDVLVHLTCSTNPSVSMQNLAADARENIATSVELFQAAVDAGVHTIVFASSGGTVYGKPTTLPVRECDGGTPLSGYGASKLAIEHYLGLARGPARGISLRIGNPYGPYQYRGASVGFIASALKALAAGEPVHLYGTGDVVRDYIYIDDVADAFVRVSLDSSVPSGSYNVGSGSGCSLLEMIELIEAVTGRRLRVSREQARGFDVPEVYLDTAKLRSATGWSPTVDLRSGVARMWRALGED